jgi:hypothetical protein
MQRRQRNAVAQNGAAMVRKARLSKEAFIRDYLERQGSFRGDGYDHAYAVAVRIAAADPTLEIVNEPSIVAGREIPGWRLRRKASP